jgi:hypothetical protein
LCIFIRNFVDFFWQASSVQPIFFDLQIIGKPQPFPCLFAFRASPNAGQVLFPQHLQKATMLIWTHEFLCVLCPWEKNVQLDSGPSQEHKNGEEAGER